MGIFTILVFIAIGLANGATAAMIMPIEKSKRWLIADLIMSVLGIAIGNGIFRVIGTQGFTGLNLWSFFVAWVGALVGALILRLFFWHLDQKQLI
jgi:uncharacterized membrane protein YeaQ/YmgE (transglycosylase-associated protein family)